MGRAKDAISRWYGAPGRDTLWEVLRRLDDNAGGGSGAASPSDITNWTTYHVDEVTGTNETVAANPLRGQPGTPFRTIAFAIQEFRATYPLANSYATWANQKLILHLGAGRFTAAVQGASIDIPLVRRSMAITGYGAIVESALVIQNDKALVPDGNAFNPANLPAPWAGAAYGSTVGIEIVGLSSVDVRDGDDQPGLTLLGQVTVTTFAAVGQTLQPRIQVVRAWVNGGFHVLGANLSQSEVPFYAEGAAFGTAPSFGSVPTVVGCDGPVGLSAVSLLLSGKRTTFYDRVGPFVTFGDVEDCFFTSIRRDLDFAGAPVAGVIQSANDGGFYDCQFVSPGRGDYGFVMGTGDEVSPRPFRADDNSLVSIASQLPTFDHLQSVGLDVSNLLHSYVAVAGSDVVAAPGISAVPYATIGAAVATAQDGTVIHVSPGSYASNAQWPAIAHLSIVGEDPSNTSIFANLDAQPAFRITSASARGGRIANIRFEKTGLTTTVGCVHVDNVASNADFLRDGLLIENCIAERNQPGGAAAGLYYAWYVNGASKVTMRGCQGGITDTLNADFHAWDCQIYAQGDVPNALTVTGPVLGTLTRPWTGSHYHGCEIKGEIAVTETAGLRLGGTPWIELDAGCVVDDAIQSVAPLVDANAGAQIPRIVSRARYKPSDLHSLTFACTVNPAYVDLSDSIFASESAVALSNLIIDASASTPRQPVNMQGMFVFGLDLSLQVDGDIRGGRYGALNFALAAVTGTTCDRDDVTLGGRTLDGGGNGAITGICPWPNLITPALFAQQNTVPGAALGITGANLTGPSAGGGSLAIGTGTAGAAYTAHVVRRQLT